MVSNKRVGVVVGLLFLASTGAAHGQVRVVKKTAPKIGPNEEVVYDNWTSSWGLRDDPPDKYPLGIATHKTEAEAVAAAKAAIARTAGNGDLAITHFLIEGEPSVRNKIVARAESAKDLLDRVKEAKKAVDEAKKIAKGDEPLLKASERKLGDTIKEYKDMVTKSFAQVTEAKKTLTGGVASLTDAKFRQVNGLIDQYNRQVNGFRLVMGNSANLGFSPMARIVRDPVAGKKASGRLDIRNFYVTFGTDGTLSAYTTRNTTEKPFTGRYTISGDRIEFELGPSKFVGRIKGNRITGTRSRSDGVSDDWELTLD